MSRFEGVQAMVGVKRSLVLAVMAASTVAMLSTPANADDSKSKAATHKAAPKKHVVKEAAAKVAPGGCQPTPEQASIGIRALQTELMVAGLKCSAEQWNAFTAKFKATIKTDADRMQKLFSKAYGKGGANQMNAFVTQLANDASQRSNGFSEAEYCKQQDVLFQKVLALTALELERFSASRPLTTPAPVALCKPEPETVTTPPLVTATATPPEAPATAAKPVALRP